MGKKVYPEASKLLINADGGGSNGRRNKLWKIQLQEFANEVGMEMHMCHFPPGTSKWNKIEHRMFSYISQNWRGKPLVSYEVIVNLIGSTKTNKGLIIKCELDTGKYETGKKISDIEMNKIDLELDEFHGEWNYKIKPKGAV
jgi:hypothetical protein